MARKYNITAKQLKKLGFRKEVVTPEEAGTIKGFHYFIYEFSTEFYQSLALMSESNDERTHGRYYTVSFFDHDEIVITTIGDLRDLLKILKKNVVKK